MMRPPDSHSFAPPSSLRRSADPPRTLRRTVPRPYLRQPLTVVDERTDVAPSRFEPPPSARARSAFDAEQQHTDRRPRYDAPDRGTTPAEFWHHSDSAGSDVRTSSSLSSEGVPPRPTHPQRHERYAALLLNEPDNGVAIDTKEFVAPLRNARDTFSALATQDPVYGDLARRFQFAETVRERELAAFQRIPKKFLSGAREYDHPRHEADSRAISTSIVDHLAGHRHTTFPVNAPKHDTLLDIVKQHREPGEPRRYVMRLSNSGVGLAEHHQQRGLSVNGTPKYQTIYEVSDAHVGPGRDALNVDALQDLVKFRKPTDTLTGMAQVYAWMDSRGTKLPPNPEHVTQTRGKSGNCSTCSIDVYARNELSELNYQRYRSTNASMTASALAQASRRSARVAPLRDKAAHAELKATRPDVYADEEARVGRERWYIGRKGNDDAARLVQRSADHHQRRTFAVHRERDARGDYAVTVATGPRSAMTSRIDFDPAAATYTVLRGPVHGSYATIRDVAAAAMGLDMRPRGERQDR